MLFEEFDMKEYVKMERRDSFFEGKEVGKIEGKAEFLVEMLEEKGNISDELRKKILSEKDIEILKQWMKLAMSVSAVFEFEEKM